MLTGAGEPNPPSRRILVVCCDRFAGSQEDFQGWIEWLREKGVSVVSITKPPGNPRAG